MYLDGDFLYIMLATAIMSAQNWSSQPALLGHMIRIGLHAPILPIILFPATPDPELRTKDTRRGARRPISSLAAKERGQICVCLVDDGRTAMAMAAMRHMSPIALGGRAGRMVRATRQTVVREDDSKI